MAIYATIVPDHEEIIAAVAARNPDAANRAMQRHLDHAHEFQKEFIASRDEIQRR
jgi:DNA-binding FadR family transcriptional regulator